MKDKIIIKTYNKKKTDITAKNITMWKSAFFLFYCLGKRDGNEIKIKKEKGKMKRKADKAKRHYYRQLAKTCSSFSLTASRSTRAFLFLLHEKTKKMKRNKENMTCVVEKNIQNQQREDKES